jgi:hypothetical protein
MKSNRLWSGGMIVPTAKLDSVKTEPPPSPVVVPAIVMKWEITMTSCLRSGVGGLLLYIGKSNATLHFSPLCRCSDAMQPMW